MSSILSHFVTAEIKRENLERSKERFWLGKALLNSVLCIDKIVGTLKLTGEAQQQVGYMEQFTCVTHKSLLGSSE